MKRVILSAMLVVCLTGACTGQPELVLREPAAAPTGPNNAAIPTPDNEKDQPEQGAPEPDPVPYVPAGKVGNAQEYADMIARLEQVVPEDLRSEVPWPDLRNPNPITAQIEIFELWIWMAANYPDPQLVEAMSAPGSPSRENVVSVFGRLQRDNVFEVRTGQPYRAFDHVVVTFESAGLPLWLGRDVPEGAVVVYYSDSSGPVDTIDQQTGAIIGVESGLATRTWLSIMVPTDVGWQLWHDQLLDPSDSELEVPDVPPPPGADEEERVLSRGLRCRSRPSSSLPCLPHG